MSKDHNNHPLEIGNVVLARMGNGGIGIGTIRAIEGRNIHISFRDRTELCCRAEETLKIPSIILNGK